jgi:hypothetical protein
MSVCSLVLFPRLLTASPTQNSTPHLYLQEQQLGEKYEYDFGDDLVVSPRAAEVFIDLKCHINLFRRLIGGQLRACSDFVHP